MSTLKYFSCIVLLIFQSISAQNFWQQTNGPYSNESVYLYDIESDESNQIFAGVRDKGMFLSTDNGDNWFAINNGLPLYSSPRIAIGQNYIYTAISNEGVYRSSNNGVIWIQVNNGLTNLNLISIAVNQVGHVFVGQAVVEYLDQLTMVIVGSPKTSDYLQVFQ
jgi:hypothetical protein